MKMTVRRRLFLFGGFLSIIILLVAVIAVVFAGRPNYVQYSSVPFTAGERYLTDEFEPAFSFETVGEGWGLDGPEAPYVVALRGRGLNIDFQNIEDFVVFDPGNAEEVPAPKDMVGWYQDHPYLDTEAPESVSVGGVEGVYFDAVMTTLPEGYDASACKDPLKPTEKSLSLLSAPDGFVLCISPEDKVRIILLEDVKGEPVSIMVWSRAVDFEEVLPKAREVLDTLEWERA
jgi:hypothetical protein